MKLRALVALIALALAGASLAYAAPKALSKKPDPATSTGATTHGKKPKTGPGCRPRVVVILRGTYDATETGTVDNTSVTWLDVHVNGGNHFSKRYRYKVTNTDTKVYVDGSTKYKGPGHHALGDLEPGDRLVIRAPICKQDLTAETPPDLTAKRVLAHTPKSKS